MSSLKLRSCLLLLLAALFLLTCATAESYEASTMRLLRYEGNVEISDASGNARFVMENARFNSGETMLTGEASSASVSLDSSKIVTLDAVTKVEFVKDAGQLQMNLKTGTLFLDVQKKLDENESLDIQTTTMTVGIRGTIVYVSEAAPTDGISGTSTQLGVLEGTARMTYPDENGARRLLEVPAGNLVTISSVSGTASAPVVAQLTTENINSFAMGLLESDPALMERVEQAHGLLSLSGGEAGPEGERYAAEDDWSWTEPITLIAQSASKLYDGLPLSRPADTLVFGLPTDFHIQVASVGSQTDAGVSPNRVGKYAIYNEQGEDVTTHFSDVQTIDGILRVDPVPMAVWTGSAEKIYDGTPLVNPEAGTGMYERHDDQEPIWRNSSLTIPNAAGSETMYALCGVMWVHGTNPISGETREMMLYAGQKLSVLLHNDAAEETIEFHIETLSEQDLPEDVLRVYAHNPDMLVRACQDTGWDLKVLQDLISGLSGVQDEVTVESNGLQVPENSSNSVLLDTSDVHITVDTDVTNYNGRSLRSEEAHFMPIRIPADVAVTATGSQTEIGQSVNTYSLNWGSTNPGNFIVSEDLGTLTVLPPPEEYSAEITVQAASRRKTYDGGALSTGAFQVTGLPDGYTLHARVTGTRTDVGTSGSHISNYSITDASGNDVTDLFTNVHLRNGSLTVTPASLTISTDSASKYYDGEPLTAPGADISGLVAGESASVTATGSITEIGSTQNTYSISWGSADPNNYTISEDLGTLEVIGYTMAVTFRAPTAEKVYDGTPLTYDGTISTPGDGIVTVTGLPAGFTYEVLVSGSQTEAGQAASIASNYVILGPDGSNVTSLFTSVSTENGTLTVRPAPLTVTTGSATQVYNGDNLMSTDATITGFVNGESATITAVGSTIDAGSVPNTYEINWGTTNSANYTINETLGTLTVTPAPLTVTTASAEKMYDGTPLTEIEGSSLTGLAPSDIGVVTLTVTGTITNVGNVDNTYTIDWGTAKQTNYTITETLGSLAVTQNTTPITIASDLGEKMYDGTALTVPTANVAGLPAGFTAEYSMSGSQTNVGSSDNTIASYKILKDGEDVTANFSSVTLSAGTLTVYPKALTITSGSNEKEYDGTPLTSSNVTINGLADGEEITVTTTGTITNVGSADNTFTIDWGSVSSANYMLTTDYGILVVAVNDTPITIMPVAASKPYDGQPLVAQQATVSGITGFTCNATFSGSQTSVGSTESTIATYALLDAGGNDVTSNFSSITTTPGSLEVTPAPLIITTGSDSKEYDGTGLELDEASIEGLVNGETAEVHANGIVEEFGSSPNTYTIDWGTTDPNNYSITEELGTLEITVNEQEIFITPKSATKTYDGKELRVEEADIEGLPDTVSVTYTITGSQTDAGESESTVSAFTIRDASNNDVTSYFTNVETRTGTLTVEPRPLEITTGSPAESKLYDGTPLTWPEVTIDGLAEGETATVTATGTITNAGSTPNTYSINWVNGKASNYVITETLGTLAIEPATLTIRTLGDKQRYDGNVHTSSECEVDGLVPGESITVTATASLKDVGEVEVTPEVDWGTTNQANYEITYEIGILSVMPRDLFISTGGAEVSYAERPATNAWAEIEGLVEGETATVRATGIQTETGSSKNTYEITWGTAKPGNYHIIEELGNLVVGPNEVGP